MNINLKSGSSITVDGVSYSGSNITINNGVVTVDGVDQTQTLGHKIDVAVVGNVEFIKNGSGKVKVSGSVNSVQAGSGDVEAGYVTGSVNTGSGNVKCGDVGGDVKTGTGDVVCRDVTGNVKSSTGNVTHHSITYDEAMRESHKY